MADQNQNPLLTPYQLGDLSLKNRIVMAPLTRTRAENPGHVPTDLMVEYYSQRASAGLIISEGTWVSEEAQGWYGVPGIYNEEQGEAWKRVTDAVHRRGGRIFAQLWHQGGVSHNSLYPDGRQPLAPSAVYMEQLVHVRGGSVKSDLPRAMSIADIKRTVSDYKHASRSLPAKRASTESSCRLAMCTSSISSCTRQQTAAPMNTAEVLKTAPASSSRCLMRFSMYGLANGWV